MGVTPVTFHSEGFRLVGDLVDETPAFIFRRHGAAPDVIAQARLRPRRLGVRVIAKTDIFSMDKLPSVNRRRIRSRTRHSPAPA